MNATSYIDARTFERDFSLSRRYFFKLIKDGRLVAYKPSPRKTLVSREEIEALIKASQKNRSEDAR